MYDICKQRQQGGRGIAGRIFNGNNFVLLQHNKAYSQKVGNDRFFYVRSLVPQKKAIAH